MRDDLAPFVREYRLDLDLDFRTGRFLGRVEIDLDRIQGSFPIHSRGLDLHGATLRGAPVRVEPGSDEQVLVVDPAPGGGTLALDFSGGASNDALIGLYRSRFGDGSILTTQCQPTGARRLFPCLDRPDRKAPLRLRLTTDAGLEAIFNTPVAREERVGDRIVRTFAPTPPMATYLVYLGVGRFDWLRDAGGRVAIGVATPPGRREAAAFALGHARSLLAAFEEYYGIPYPLPKLDLVTVPEHAWGAMENWGAMAFREMRLLVDAATSGRNRRETLITIAHEIGHQWFGNLVTMATWDDVWLNESFATLLQFVMVERLLHDDGVLQDFLLATYAPARLADGLSATHPVVAPASSADEIGQSFDDISYGKGTAILRMLSGFLGETTFRAGVTDYLTRFSYGNATSGDLWTALEHASGQPVGAILSAFTERAGQPLVTARTVDGGVELAQRRFLLTGAREEGTWPIPLGIVDDGGERTQLWTTPTLRLDGPPPRHLNAGGRGYYRVLYDAPLLDALERRFDRLPVYERWITLDDLFAFTLAGLIPPEVLLRFAATQRTTADYLVVEALVGQLSFLANVTFGASAEFRRAAHGFLESQWQRIGAVARPGESDAVGLLRERVANARLLVDDAFAASLAERFDDRSSAGPDLQGPIALALGRVEGDAGHRRLLHALAAESREGSAMQLECGLLASKDPSIVAVGLRELRQPPFNRAHAAQILGNAVRNPLGRDPIWSWIREDLPRFAEDHPGTDLGGNVLQIALPLVGIGRVDEVRAFVASNALPTARRGAVRGLGLLEVTDRLAQRVRRDEGAAA